MKKTLLALSVAALAAGSAQAYNFHIDQTGTDVDFYGSLRVKWESTSNKTNYVNGDVTKEHINHAVDNNGSRFGFKLKQSLGGEYKHGQNHVAKELHHAYAIQHDLKRRNHHLSFVLI